MGHLDRVEILALHVLDERELELVAGGQLPDHRRHAFEPGQLGGTDAPLAGDELVAVQRLRHEDRLDDTVVADACREAVELGRVEALPRLVRVAPDPGDRYLGRCGDGRGPLGDERGDASPKAAGGPLGSDRHRSPMV
jgi:hypothetical protein